MCGLNGILAFDKAYLFHQEIIRMTTILSHRGPDDEGFYDDSDIRLGHRRLAIIDLSSTGRQPMSNTDGSLWVVLNGEIYNYKVLKNTLESKNYQFKSTSDTEVLLHGFDEWGTDLFDKLEGMFAFALWSKNDKELFNFCPACDETGNTIQALMKGLFQEAKQLQKERDDILRINRSIAKSVSQLKEVVNNIGSLV